MTITAKLYGLVFTALFNKEIDYDSDDIKIRVVTSAYTPDQDTHNYLNDVTNEVSASGSYATGTGNEALANKTVTYTGATNKLVLDADNVSFTAATITGRTVVIYDGTPATDATRPLIGYEQSDADITSTNGTWAIVWNASGIVEITVA
jgi:hypothetical protein